MTDLELLHELGFTQYERRALQTLMQHGVADADTLCREGDIPTSKIYLALEKLAKLGLVEMQPTRPKLYSAHSTDAVFEKLIELSKARADRFAEQARALKTQFAALPTRSSGRTTFVDLALGRDGHTNRHLVHLAAAKKRIWSYMEQGDLDALGTAKGFGSALLRRISRNATANSVDHRVVFGFSYRAAPKLVAFLKRHRASLEHVTGVRYSGELGHPFHVIDDETVILCVDHPFVPQGRVASLMIRDAAFAQRLSSGFETLWDKAMKSLREISFQPNA
ncbi:MAG: helix-turn-helix domain-containing protein [Bryobacteraceae bacterium]